MSLATDMPSLVCQIAPGASPLVANPSWIDVSGWVMSGQTNRGRNYELDDFETGTAEITFNNTAGYFDPGNPNGPWFPNLRPHMPIRIGATWAGTTYWIFRGFVERWPPIRYGGKHTSKCTVTCVDWFALLAAERFDISDNGTGGGTKNLGNYSYWIFSDGFVPNNGFVGSDEATRLYCLVNVTEWGTGAPAVFHDVVLDVNYTNASGQSNRAGQIRLNHRFPSTYPTHIGRHGGRRHHKHHRVEHHHQQALRWHDRLNVQLQGNDTVHSIQSVQFKSGSFTGKNFNVNFIGERALLARGTGDQQLLSLLRYYGVPSSMINIKHAGHFTQLPYSPWDTDFLQVVREIQDTELGQIYVDRQGNITFEDVDWRYRNWGSPLTWHDGGGTGPYVYAEALPSDDNEHITTAWEVTRVSRGPNDSPQRQFYADPTACTNYGTVKGQRSPAVQTDAEALKQAAYLTARTKNAFYRIPNLTIRPRRDPSNLWPQVLPMDISQSMIVNMYPPADATNYLVSEPQWIEHVSHTFTPDDWVTDLELSPRLNLAFPS